MGMDGFPTMGRGESLAGGGKFCRRDGTVKTTGQVWMTGRDGTVQREGFT